MTDSKHTPGEWMVSNWQRAVVAPSKLGLMVAQITTGSVASTVGSSFIDEDEARANAILIAAAPDLLAALKAMLPEANRLDEHLRPSFETCEAARSAIAKAEGRQ